MKTEFAILWGIIAVVCAAIELTTGTFFLLCISVGALGALVVALLGLGFDVQLLVLSVVSALMIVAVRPLIVRCLKHGREHLSNADALMGRRCTVSQAVEAGGYGRVAVDGDDWKAESADGAAIAVGTAVEIVGRESIILKVRPLADAPGA